MSFHYCNFDLLNCVGLSVLAFVTLPILIILYLIRLVKRIQFTVTWYSQEERILYRVIYWKLAGGFLLCLISLVQLILSFFIKQEEFII